MDRHVEIFGSLCEGRTLHDAARNFFHSAKVDFWGRSYGCPFIDPYWGEDQIVAALYS